MVCDELQGKFVLDMNVIVSDQANFEKISAKKCSLPDGAQWIINILHRR